VIDEAHMRAMRDGAILANSGHFNVEINIRPWSAWPNRRDGYVHPSMSTPWGRTAYLPAGRGTPINLAAAEGHPASVMDMSFANQALCLEYLTRMKGQALAGGVSVPEDIDQEVGRLKLASMNITIDSLTRQQQRYLASWEEGT
jgi:adenosylhomocysteinase